MQRSVIGIREARQAGIAALSRFNINVKKKAATKVRGCISMSCVSETSPEKKSDLQSDSKPNDSSNPIRPPMQEVSKFSITTCSTNENETCAKRFTNSNLATAFAKLCQGYTYYIKGWQQQKKKDHRTGRFNHSPTVPSLKPFVPNTACH